MSKIVYQGDDSSHTLLNAANRGERPAQTSSLSLFVTSTRASTSGTTPTDVAASELLNASNTDPPAPGSTQQARVSGASYHMLIILASAVGLFFIFVLVCLTWYILARRRKQKTLIEVSNLGEQKDYRAGSYDSAMTFCFANAGANWSPPTKLVSTVRSHIISPYAEAQYQQRMRKSCLKLHRTFTHSLSAPAGLEPSYQCQKLYAASLDLSNQDNSSFQLQNSQVRCSAEDADSNACTNGNSLPALMEATDTFAFQENLSMELEYSSNESDNSLITTSRSETSSQTTLSSFIEEHSKDRQGFRDVPNDTPLEMSSDAAYALKLGACADPFIMVASAQELRIPAKASPSTQSNQSLNPDIYCSNPLLKEELLPPGILISGATGSSIAYRTSESDWEIDDPYEHSSFVSCPTKVNLQDVVPYPSEVADWSHFYSAFTS